MDDMNNKTVFFDVGWTLMDSPDFFGIAAGHIAGGKPDEQLYKRIVAAFMRLYNTRNTHADFKNVEEIMGETLKSVADEYGYPDISSKAREIYYDVYLEQSNLFPDVMPVLDALRGRGVKMVIASDADKELNELQMVKFGIEDYFIDRCLSDEVKAYKPAEEFVGYLRKYTQGNEQNCFFVGDNRVDVESAQALGITSVLVARKLGRNLTTDYVISDLGGLLGIVGV